MLFTYTARDKNGKEVSDKIEADSKLEAADKIFNEKKLNVINIVQADNSAKEKNENIRPKEQKTSESKLHIGHSILSPKKAEAPKAKIGSFKDAFNAANDWMLMQSKIKAKDKAVFFRLLAVMINAGLPIIKALKILSEQTANKRLQLTIQEIKEKVESGKKFSRVLGEYPDIFNEAEVGMIASGEASGQLNKTLLNLAEETEKSANIKSKIKSAMIYPISVLIILIFAGIIVMVKVIPSLKDLFISAGAELPLATRILIAGSDFLTATWILVPNWLLVIFVLIGIIALIKAWKKTKSGKYAWDNLVIKAPILGTLNTKAILATFSRQLALLSHSGVPIVRSIEITANAVGNEVYKRRLLEVKEDVEKGIAIHQSIESDPLFPAMVVNMIAVGEQTAQLGNVAQKIADFYDDEVNTFIKNISTIMEPVIIVTIAILVAGLIAAIMQPIMEISDIASQV